MPTHQLPLRQLRRVRWAVRGTLVLGVAASVAANVLHALPDPVAQIIAAWPPLALLLTVELISRVPVHRRVLAAARLLATTGIAGIAAWVSYWHMAGVASRYGERGASPFLLPLSVDGLVIVASVSLVELAGRIRAADTVASADPTVAATDTTAAAADTPPASTGPVAAVQVHRVPVAVSTGTAESTAAPNGAGSWVPDGTQPGQDRAGRGEIVTESVAAIEALTPDQASAGSRRNGRPEVRCGEDDIVVAGGQDHRAQHGVPAAPDPPDDGPPAEPRAAIAYWQTKDPSLRPGDIAARVGRSRSTVRRILAELAGADATESGNTRAAPDAADTGAAGDHAAGAGVNGNATPLAGSYVSD